MAGEEAAGGGGGGAGMGAGGMAAMGSAGIGILFGAFATYEAGRARKKMFRYNARVGEYQAQDAIARGVVAADRRREETQQIIGGMRARGGHSGVDVNEGSMLEVQANAAYLGELDAVTITNNAAREAWGYKVAAQNASNAGRYAGMEGTMGATQTVITGASNLMLAKYGYGRGATTTDPQVKR